MFRRRRDDWYEVALGIPYANYLASETLSNSVFLFFFCFFFCYNAMQSKAWSLNHQSGVIH